MGDSGNLHMNLSAVELEESHRICNQSNFFLEFQGVETENATAV